MLSAAISLLFLLVFAELASANFKRLAPVLEAWNQARKSPHLRATDTNPFPWIGGWEKLAALVWAIGASIPLLAFALACHFFVQDTVQAGNFVLGSTVGSNIIGLSLAFAFILFSGPLTFFRIRSVTSPVFLLIASVIFVCVSLNRVITIWESLILFSLLMGYGFYFRRFSSEWKHFERAFAHQSLVESAEGILPILAVFCMGIGFFALAIVSAYPFVTELSQLSETGHLGPFRIGAHFVAFVLSVPWLTRCLVSLRAGTTSKAIALTSISHSCLINVLLIPAAAALLGASDLSMNMLSYYLPVVLTLTGIFVAALLIEKEKGGKLPWFLILSYLLYTGIGLFF